MLSVLKKEFISSMPKGIGSLFFMQVVSTLSFSVLYSTLVLYMENKLRLAPIDANNVMGVFIAFNFGLHLIGGLWGGRLLSNRSLFCIGMVFQIVGCFILSLGQAGLLYGGLAFFLTGSGLNVTCLNCMLTQRFSTNDSRREFAFLLNYAGMNIGFFVGFTLSGFYQLNQNYQQLFLISSGGNLGALLICCYFWRQLDDKDTAFSNKNKTQQTHSIFLGVGLICTIPFILLLLLDHVQWAKNLILISGLMVFAVIFYCAKKQPTQQATNRLCAFAVLLIAGIIFFMLYNIAPMGLTVFIDHNVHRHFETFTIAPQWFQNINTLAIIIGGPLLGIVLNVLRRKGWQVNISTQFVMALLSIGLAFMLLPCGIAYADANGLVNPFWVVGSYVFQSIGELLIAPIGYAMIGLLAPNSLQGMMMGMWMLGSGIGGSLSSYCSNWMIEGSQSILPIHTNPGYSHVFLILSGFALSAGLVLYFFIPYLRRLTQEVYVMPVDGTVLESSKRVIGCE